MKIDLLDIVIYNNTEKVKTEQNLDNRVYLELNDDYQDYQQRRQDKVTQKESKRVIEIELF